jgi:hypothetical protein
VSHPRLPWLLAVMVVLLAGRWAVPWHGSATGEVVQAVHRPAAASSTPAAAASMPAPARTGAASVHQPWRDPALFDPGNAFAVRVAATPATPPASVTPARSASKPKPSQPEVLAVAVPPAPMPAPEPAVPLSVIGTWVDDKGPSVFLSSPRSTVQGRVGDVLLAEYQVVQISTSQVVLRHLRTERETRLSVPSVPNTLPSAAMALR